MTDGDAEHADAHYRNADARPHTGDHVRVDSSETSVLTSDVYGRVTGRTERRGRVRVGVRTPQGTHTFDPSALSLEKATTPRFDGYDPESDE
jgi:hypothetical protein